MITAVPGVEEVVRVLRWLLRQCGGVSLDGDFAILFTFGSWRQKLFFVGPAGRPRPINIPSKYFILTLFLLARVAFS